MKDELSADRSPSLRCNQSHGRCVKVKTCWESKDCRPPISFVPDNTEHSVSINLEALDSLDRERVKRAMVHLKSLFPLVKAPKELFDR